MTDERNDPDELETRAVLARAYAAPSPAEVESALGLVRFRLPARRPRNWLGGVTKIAAALVMMAGMFGAGLWTAGFRGMRGEAVLRPMSAMPALLASSADSVATSVESIADGLVDGTRRYHFRLFETRADGTRRVLRDTVLAAPTGSDFRLAIHGSGNDPFTSGMLPGPSFSADFAAHVLPGGALFLSSFISKIEPVGRSGMADREHYARVTYDQAWFKRSIQVARGASVTFYPDGEPRAGETKLGFEVSLDTGRARAIVPTALSPLEWPRALSIRLVPRMQGAFVKVEVGDGTTWQTVYDRPKVLLTRMPGVFFVPGAPYPESRVRVELRPAGDGPGTPLCLYWSRDHVGRPPYGGGACLSEDGSPRVVPMYGSGGKMLRLTLLGSFVRAPWERP